MSFAQTDDDKRRLWNAVGGLFIGDSAGDSDFSVSTRNGRVSINTGPAVSPVVANVGGYGITMPMVLLVGAVLALIVARK